MIIENSDEFPYKMLEIVDPLEMPKNGAPKCIKKM